MRGGRSKHMSVQILFSNKTQGAITLFVNCNLAHKSGGGKKTNRISRETVLAKTLKKWIDELFQYKRGAGPKKCV